MWCFFTSGPKCHISSLMREKGPNAPLHGVWVEDQSWVYGTFKFPWASVAPFVSEHEITLGSEWRRGELGA